MQNQPVWITLQDKAENSVLYLQLLNLINNKEELRGFVQASGCGSGSCKSGTGCCHG